MSVRIRVLVVAMALALPVAASGGEPEAALSQGSEAPASLDAAEGAVCKVDDGATASALVGRSEAVARLQERLRAELAEGGEPAIVLNGKGYGYDVKQQQSPADVLRLLEREAALER